MKISKSLHMEPNLSTALKVMNVIKLAESIMQLIFRRLPFLRVIINVWGGGIC